MASYPAAIMPLMVRGALMSDPVTQGDFVDTLQDELRSVQQILGTNPQGAYATVKAAITPSAWTTLTLLNGWVRQSGAHSPPQYRKIGDIVHVRFAVSNPTPLAIPGVQGVFTLPVGHRPPYTGNNPAVIMADANLWGAHGYLNLNTNGLVEIVRTSLGPSQPHVFTAGEFAFSVTP